MHEEEPALVAVLEEKGLGQKNDEKNEREMPPYSPFRSCPRDLVIARLTMHHTWDCFKGRKQKTGPQKQSRDALSTSLFPGLLRNSEMASIALLRRTCVAM